MTNERLVSEGELRQVLEALEFFWRDVPMNDYGFERLEAAIATLRRILEAPALSEWKLANAMWNMYGHGEARNTASAQHEVQALSVLLRGAPKENAQPQGEREAFEAWAVRTHGKHTLSDPDAGSMWSAWQARAERGRQR